MSSIHNDKKIKKSNWLPGVLLMYMVAMTFIFGPEYVAGDTVGFIFIILAELFVIFLLRYFLKKIERQERRRGR